MNSPLLTIKRHYWRHLKINAFARDYRSYWLAPSYAQEGEDIILRRLFEGQKTGFFVDVGAHHPKRYSNSYYLYLNGWRGINIDAAPGSMEGFRKLRPRDINLELAVANSKRTLTYYMFSEPALNGFSKEISMQRNESGPYKIIGERQIEPVTLAELLDRYLPPSQPIDFLNIDVEGLDLEVLESNDWAKYQPTLVLAEDLWFSDFRQMHKSPVIRLMQQYDYDLYCKTVNTLIFRKIGRQLPYEQHGKFEQGDRGNTGPGC